MKKHYARYTPEMVEKVCGCSKKSSFRVAEALLANSGRDRTGSIVYAVGWTQHTTGTQIIRTAGMVQEMLGNMGRPGGGILALRGHATIQGSTDIPTLYHSWSGYLAAADARRNHDTLKDYIPTETQITSLVEHAEVRREYAQSMGLAMPPLPQMISATTLCRRSPAITTHANVCVNESKAA